MACLCAVCESKQTENMTSLAEETIVLREQLIMQAASGLHLGLNLQMFSAMDDWNIYDFDLGHRLTPPPQKKHCSKIK